MSDKDGPEKNSSRKSILLVNDDGVGAPGIKHLYDAFSSRHNVVVVAPRREQSGVSHSFTFRGYLRYEPIPDHYRMNGFVLDGTPSDCVKFAVGHLFPQKPDAVVSGMNVGENSGLSGFYSGTVAGAREGAFWDIPSFAFSVDETGEEYSVLYAVQALFLFNNLMQRARIDLREAGYRVYFNVNFPACTPNRCSGVKLTRQSCAFFDDRYRCVRDKQGREQFCLFGKKVELETSDDFDSRALLNNFITITPLHFDATAYDVLQRMTLPSVFKEGA